MTGDNGIWFVGGAGIGFFLSIFVLDRYYGTLMKDVIEEIHKNYARAIEILKQQYEKDNTNTD